MTREELEAATRRSLERFHERNTRHPYPRRWPRRSDQRQVERGEQDRQRSLFDDEVGQW